MANYAKTAAGALKSIRKAGQAAAIRRVLLGDIDTDTGRREVISNVDHACVAVSFDYELRDSGLGRADGTLIQQGDKQILIPAAGLSIAPVPGDKVVISSTVWTVVNVKSVNPAGTPILYEIQGRR